MKFANILSLKALVSLFILFFGLISLNIYGQTIESPFTITENTFSELKLKHDLIVDDKQGEQYKVVNTSLEKGLLILTNEEWKKHGRYFRYSNGKLSIETTFQFDVKEGKEIKFFSDGQKNWEYEYSNGEKTGSFAIFYQINGQKYQTGTYKNDIKDGEEMTYYENGIAKELKTYQNGKVSKAIQYNSEGVKIAENAYDIN